MSDGEFLRPLRAAALAALLAGAAGSVALLALAGRHAPPVLWAPFLVWVLSPFVILLFAERILKRWPLPTRGALYGVMLAVAVGSLAVYIDDAFGHRRPQAAFVYVAVPPASWLLIAIVLAIAALVSRRRSRR